MTITASIRLATLGLALVAAACDDAATTAVVDNAGTATVYKVWWVTTLFPDPVAAGGTSAAQRTVPASDFAYALLAPDWAPDDAGPPPRLVAIRSAQRLSVASHGRLRIVVSAEQFTGDCAAGAPLGADDARLIVERIFPGDFAGVSYDPATCTAAPVDGDAGAADAGDGGAGLDSAP